MDFFQFNFYQVASAGRFVVVMRFIDYSSNNVHYRHFYFGCNGVMDNNYSYTVIDGILTYNAITL